MLISIFAKRRELDLMCRITRRSDRACVRFAPQENDVEREFQVHRTERDYALAEVWRWIIAFLIGVTMGFLGFAVDWGIGLLNDAKYFRTQQVIISEREYSYEQSSFDTKFC